MIKNYKKKPVLIQACVWTGKNQEELQKFAGDSVTILDVHRSDGVFKSCIIRTLEGTMSADIGDFIIKGIKGEFYPCKPDVFEKTYEEVSTDCASYEKGTRKKPFYSRETGAIAGYTIVEYGFCNGTKEREECNCKGDKSKCDFYDNEFKASTTPTEVQNCKVPKNFEAVYSRCDKCVNTNSCIMNKSLLPDEYDCPRYRRDPPDGGFYG